MSMNMNMNMNILIDGSEEKYGGKVVTYIHNPQDNYPKDQTVAKFIPDQISSCAVHLDKKPGEPCASDVTIKAISKITGIEGTPKEIINEAAQKLGCKQEGAAGEICVYKKLEKDIGLQLVNIEIEINHKPEGPTDSKLLSNINIDIQIQQWMIVFPEFFAYNFNMRNYASYKFRHGRVIEAPDTLATILFEDIVRGTWVKYIDEIPYMEKIAYIAGAARKLGAVGGDTNYKQSKQFKCAGCIINKDVYQGGGTHWMALFADVRGSRYTVEFFNSSGNAPDAEWVNWMVKTKAGIENLINEGVLKKPENGTVELIKVSNIRHQKSKSECGVYSLFYIWLRLNGIPPEYFMTNPIADQHMFEFREHLFRDSLRKPLSKFDWDVYLKNVNTKWE